MVTPQRINPAWASEPCVVMATGPSLTSQVVHQVRMARWKNGWRVIAVNDAYRLLPHADILYACDWGWWRHHQGAKEAAGERWTCHGTDPSYCDDKSLVAHEYDVQLVAARIGRGFSQCPEFIHYGHPHGSSGFQAVNLALLLGSPLVVLVGFDGHAKRGKHFFGDHPPHLDRCDDRGYRDLARSFVPDERIVNATPGSSIEVYRFGDLEEILRDNRVYRNGSVTHAGTDIRGAT